MKLYIFMCVITNYVICYPIEPDSIGCNKECQLNYLLKFGYLQPENNNIIGLLHDQNLREGIINLQKDAGLEPTGILNSETMILLQTPRCGVKWSSPRKKRFTIVHGWQNQKNELNETIVTYYLDLSNFKYIKSLNLTQEIISSIFADIMNQWSNTSLLSIKQVENVQDANITIKFLKGNHGDGYNFDGPGQILAHAFFPGTGRGGDAHFDLEENWTLWEEDSGTSLYSVSLHELGHSLGLSHSSQKDAVMYAWYQSNKFKLQEDDKNGINSIYGLKPKYKFAPLDPKFRIYSTPPTTTPPTTKRTRQTPPTTPTTERTRQTPPRLPIIPRIKLTTTTEKYNLKKIKKFLIQNSRVYIYPKSGLSF
ncbi:matrix metalloproteinase-17-like [Invertebrate iridescent virus 22]|uniref:Matrix metalloproteinase-17-like n=1 Tax=Invertebrate iridescent virus 22 TaxID=345198 RepID=W8W1A0_9VIRU|nr:matrix metalloproteinase-17-like [Invertebrate iridescent virus 22]CCV01862.1 matrix metalloproteinase-17-like [Invertebrate iridescent virus 22]